MRRKYIFLIRIHEIESSNPAEPATDGINHCDRGNVSRERGINGGELGINHDKRGINGGKLGINHDECGINGGELGINHDERGINHDEREKRQRARNHFAAAQAWSR